jgi:hypothetical protein
MAYEFNGSNQWMTTASSPISAAPLTMACWFKSDSASALQSLVHLVNVGGQNSYYGLFARGDIANDPIQFFVFSGGATFQGTDTTAGYSANTWHHACGVAASDTSRTAYLDGGNSATGTANISTTPSQIRIGRFVDSFGAASFYMDGLIAEVGIWNAALTAAEVASLADGMTCDKVRGQSLVFYAPLIRSLQDLRGGLSITNNNTATVANHPRVYA